MKVSNNRSRPFVQNKKEFKGNNLFAVNKGDKYVVYSYGEHFPLFVFSNGTWYENEDRYSVTTSKQKTQSHPLCKTKKVSTKWLCDEIKQANKLVNQFKVGDKVINNDKNSWYFGKECIVNEVTFYPARTGRFKCEDMFVYSVSFENYGFALRETEILPTS